MLMGLLFADGARAAAPLPAAGAAAVGRVAARRDRASSPRSSRRSPPCCPRSGPARALFAALQGRSTGSTLGALWTTALALVVLARVAFGALLLRRLEQGPGGAQGALHPPARRWIVGVRAPAAAGRTPRALLVKDLKVFLRDTTQWSQLLLLLALALVYLYNFHVLDLDRIPYMSGADQERLRLREPGHGRLRARRPSPCASSSRRSPPKGAAFWIVRTSPVAHARASCGRSSGPACRPLLLLAEALTILSNQLLGVAPVLQAAGRRRDPRHDLRPRRAWPRAWAPRYPRFAAENVTQVAGSYGGIAFMVLAVLFILVEIGLLGLARLDLPLASVPGPCRCRPGLPGLMVACLRAGAPVAGRRHLLAAHAPAASARSRRLGD